MRVIATGHSGTIGRHLKNVTPYLGDIRDTTKYGQLGNNDCLLHLAGIVGAKSVADSKQVAHDINVSATLNLAAEAIKRNFSQFIYVSTSHVYGNTSGVISEESHTSPITEYASQKLEAENRLRELFIGAPSKLIILRLFSILGNEMPSFTLGGLLDQLPTDHTLKVSCSQDVRDFLSPVQAAVSLSLLAHENWATGDTYNLCTGSGLTVKEASKQYLGAKGYIVDENRFEPGYSDVPQIIGKNHKLVNKVPALQKYVEKFKPSMNEN